MLICQLTDLHFRFDGTREYFAAPTNLFVEQAFGSVASLDPAPDLVLITGDLTEHGLAVEYDGLVKLIRETLPMPVYAIPGNHDDSALLAASMTELSELHRTADAVQYVIEYDALRVVMLDTVVAGADHGELSAERLAFLAAALAARPDVPTIIAMHHPPVTCGIAHMDRNALRDPGAFAAIVAQNRQVERIVCGHVHRPITGRLGHVTVSVAPSVTCPIALLLRPDAEGAYVMEPPAYNLHLWRPLEGLVTHQVYANPFPGPFSFT